MAPSGLPALLLFMAATANCQLLGFNISLVTAGLLPAGNPYATFAIISFPPCKYNGQTASLNIVPTGGTARTETFTVPACRTRRDAIIIADSNTGNTIIKNVGYEIDNLTPNVNYTVTYTITATDTSNSFPFTAANRINYQDIPDTMARSGGMVVITVLLSIAMAILVVGLIVTIVLGGKRS